MRPPHFYEPGAVFFITTRIESSNPHLLADEGNALILIEDMKFYRRKFDLKIFFYVIMPDHFHWVIQPSPENFQKFKEDQLKKRKKYHKAPERYYLSKLMEDFKRHSSFAINERMGTKGARVWQDGFYDEMIRDVESLNKIAEYIHNNPVETGLVDEPGDYKFSSYRNIFLEDESLIKLDRIECL
jgi:REP element-mobilizing transposase RayT